jgi:hypothetical protein
MKWPVVVLSLSLAVATTRPAHASEDVQLTVRADRQSVQIIEPIQLEVTVVAPAGTTVVLPEVGDTWGSFQVQDRSLIADVPTAHPTRRRWTLKLTLDTLQPGDWTIPAISVKYRAPAAEEFKTLVSDPIPIHVVSLLEDRGQPTDFRDIKPAVEIQDPQPLNNHWQRWAVAGGIAILALAGGSFALLRRPKTLTLQGWALGQIDQIHSAFEAGKIAPSAAFGELCNMLREFQRDRFDSATPPANGDVPDPDFLSMADDVKYANLEVSADQVRAAICRSREYVQSGSTSAAVVTAAKTTTKSVAEKAGEAD